MITIRLSWAAIILGLAMPAPAAAATLPNGFTLSGEAAIVSDYRFRGISLSQGRPAAQGGLTLEHESGLYGSVWSSSIARSEGGANAEIDLVAGFVAEFGGGVEADLSVAYYLYPSDSAISFVEASATLSRSFGPATPRLGISYAPAQGTMRDSFGIARDNVHLSAGLELAVPGAPVTLEGQIGFESGYFDACETGGKVDWRIGGTLALHGFGLGLQYTDSDAMLHDARGRDLAGATAVVSLGFSF